MTQPFFITGLPRSRSAWISNWLTTVRSLCFHDMPFDEDLLRCASYVGFAGPELVTQFSAVRKDYPSSKWVVVLRKSEDALNSFLAWSRDLVNGEDAKQFWNTRVYELEKLTMSPNVRRVAYQELDSEMHARDLWEFLLPDIPFDPVRWCLLQRLNIQQDKTKGNIWPLAPLRP